MWKKITVEDLVIIKETGEEGVVVSVGIDTGSGIKTYGVSVWSKEACPVGSLYMGTLKRFKESEIELKWDVIEAKD